MLFRLFSIVLFSAFTCTALVAERPNVLFISVDDLNDFPAFSGRYPDAKTPHMDRLAAQGMVFSRAHSQYPLCGPSRASIMAGLLPSTLGYDTHMKDEAVARRAADLGTELLHTYFANHGYTTLAVGKIFHHHVPKGSVDRSGGRGGFNEPTGKLRQNWPQRGTSTDWARAPERDDQLPDHAAAEWAVKQLQADHEKPFFLMVGFLRPHVPWYVPEKWFDLYDRDEIALPPYKKDDLDDIPEIAKRISILEQMPRTDWAIENDQWRDIVHAYLACISFADHQVGKVLDALATSPYAGNTIVVLWSDHGYHLGEKNTFQKMSLWERSSHVPLVISAPGVEAGIRCDRVVSLLDLYPTLVEMAGLPANDKTEGRSLVPLLESPSIRWPYPAITGWKENSFAIQGERYRYLRYGDGSEELYDHSSDLDEQHNLAGNPDYKAVKKLMALTLRTILNEGTGEQDTARKAAELREQCASLGATAIFP
ncbi:sulfatase [Coraliomargarita sinensis]|uniref:Sulfatase n=1 Tax=Coraliomargarita sinensis TaxID=2174842 RepID=A0A317ZKQ6_9BACT|nr:sulfatase [Coraliomargarita sinensis]PXA04399.1 sulfatase [Coraliomargarita sinensis]